MKIYNLIQLKNSHMFFLILYGVLLSIALIPYYTNGTIILGGEGDYFLDFSMYSENYGFTWLSVCGSGLPMYAPSANGLNILLLIICEKLSGSIAITNFILIFSIYFWPFLGMYLVCKEVKASPFISFIIAFFYVINPFMLYYLIAINQWNVFSVAVMPLLLWGILKYYDANFKQFFLFGVISTCFSFAYANPPMLVIIQISILLSVVMASYYHNNRFILTEVIKKYSVVFFSFVSFNMWWILVLFHSLSSAKEFYSKEFAVAWLNIVTCFANTLGTIWHLTNHIPRDSSHDFFSYWYNTIPARFITLIPIFVILVYVFIIRNEKTRNALNLTIFGVLLTVLFFVKGNADPFGFIYSLMFKYIPFFNIFKTPTEKFGLLYVFIFTVLLLIVLKESNKKSYFKYFIGGVTAYLIFCSIPAITGNILPEYKVSPWGYVSRKYKDKTEYKQVREFFNKDMIPYRILSLPGAGNYQILMDNYGGKHYSGLDPILNNINKPFIAPHHNIHLLYSNFSSVGYKKLLGIYNVGKIMINKTNRPWFGIVEKEGIAELKKTFDTFMPSKRWESITIYDNKDYFLHRIYASKEM